ncbi:MAG: serine/threonine-protein kinase [Planctomycetota bacterium]
MSAKKPSLNELVEAALAIDSAEGRERFLREQCDGDPALREQLRQRLADSAGERSRQVDAQRTASLDAGLATAFDEQEAVVLGRSDHSVLSSLGETVDVRRVSLRETGGEPQDESRRDSDAKFDSRYRLEGEIARGGMGAILKGRDTDLGRDLAIKVLLDHHKNDPRVIERFIEEAQIGGQLQHPGIAPVYELGQFADRRPFFSMKLIKGETLSRLLGERTDPAEDRGRFIGIFEQICQTMAYAHARGVIHRDLKPANVMVGAFGEVQVMDWGLAKVLSSEPEVG